MHQDEPRLLLGHHVGHFRLTQRRDVVDHNRPRLQGGPGDAGLGRVDRDPGPAGNQPGDRRDDAFFLHRGIDRVGSGTGGFASNVNEVGPIRHQAQAVGDRRVG